MLSILINVQINCMDLERECFIKYGISLKFLKGQCFLTIRRTPTILILQTFYGNIVKIYNIHCVRSTYIRIKHSL